MQTAVTAHFLSKHLLLFACTLQNRGDIQVKVSITTTPMVFTMEK